MRHTKLPIVLFTILLISGCATGGKYPSNWAGKDERLHNCSALNGRYNNFGENAEYPKAKTFLSQIFQFPSVDWNFTVEVRISVNDDSTVDATIWDKKGVQIIEESKLKFVCSNGKLFWEGDISELSEGRGKDNPLFGVQKVKIEISKGTDGALYYLNEEKGGGLVYMFLPIVYSGSTWTRFDAIH